MATTVKAVSSDAVKQSFAKLKQAASTLNTSSDKLSASISELEAELKKLALGVSSSVEFEERAPDFVNWFDCDNISYTRINGKWGLAIESYRGRHDHPDDLSEERWPFNEAPRAKRVKAVKFIPDLIEKLAKDAIGMAAEIEAQVDNVKEITSAINSESPFGAKLLQALRPEKAEAPEPPDDSEFIDILGPVQMPRVSN